MRLQIGHMSSNFSNLQGKVRRGGRTSYQGESTKGVPAVVPASGDRNSPKVAQNYLNCEGIQYQFINGHTDKSQRTPETREPQPTRRRADRDGQPIVDTRNSRTVLLNCAKNWGWVQLEGENPQMPEGSPREHRGMRNMGWDGDHGLGKREQGRFEPIAAGTSSTHLSGEAESKTKKKSRRIRYSRYGTMIWLVKNIKLLR